MSNFTKEGDFELSNPPKDGISSLCFFKEIKTNPSYLISTSWDGSIQIYDTRLDKLVSKIVPTPTRPLLSACQIHINNFSVIWAGGLSGILYCIDWKNEEILFQINEAHLAPIKSLVSLSGTNFFISGGWDSSLCLWETIASTSSASISASLVSKVSLPEKVYTIDAQPISNDKYRIVVGMANRNIHIFEIVKSSPELVCVQKRESSLKYQTRSIKISPLLPNVFVCSSIEGRVSVDYLDVEDQSKKYAFKCHRSTLSDDEVKEIVYPVNAVAFHPKSLIFATGGSDSTVCIWDLSAKKRLKFFSGFPTSISAMDFDSSGEILAIASSYCYEEGEKDHPLDAIYIKRIELSHK